MAKAMMLVPAAIHINTNICIPNDAPMLIAATDVIAFFMMMNSAVASTVATVVKSAPRKVTIAMGRVAQREKTPRGIRKIMRKFTQAPARKRANIQLETMRRRLRMSFTSDGRATGNMLASLSA